MLTLLYPITLHLRLACHAVQLVLTCYVGLYRWRTLAGYCAPARFLPLYAHLLALTTCVKTFTIAWFHHFTVPRAGLRARGLRTLAAAYLVAYRSTHMRTGLRRLRTTSCCCVPPTAFNNCLAALWFASDTRLLSRTSLLLRFLVLTTFVTP